MSGFRATYGTAPAGTWAAPGRVNLIGEHTDYNDGFVMPFALPQTVRATARRRDDGLLRLHSAHGDGRTVELKVAELRPDGVTGWARYPAGVVWTLAAEGHRVGGADLYFESDVPAGAGLSSSAALECATAAAFRDLWQLDLDDTRLALVAQRAENDFVGVPCGIMDQLASMCAQSGHALLLDTRSLAQRQVRLDLDRHGLRLLVVDTRVRHELADGAYAALRSGCERAARLLGLAALRDLTVPELTGALDRLPAELGPLVRHVVTENARVADAAAALDAGDAAALGPVLTEGHHSLRDDYRVSCPETDLAVRIAVEAGALGARMTGAGFGGSVIALVPQERTAGVTAAVTEAFAAAGHRAPRTFTATAAAGARRLD
ncbi:galactokinase [Streptomyces sp. XM4193]|uniref:galactokinase n=1 Tax=Streptomyces sp. XM4193 TaxID=2929782 RepID=UPI001FFA0869|nr:galactokinase [Streptomyces sp. XM4193]MCK1795288.1 galactokinase [Streptomyces sp. XM4193]